MPKIIPGLGERLRFVRAQKGFTQVYVGEHFLKDAWAICRYETGLSTPSAAALRDLCVFYEISADWLIFGGEDRGTVVPHNLKIQDNIKNKLPPGKIKIRSLARLLKVDRATLNSALLGKNAYLETIIKLSHGLNTSCDYLLFGSEEYIKRYPPWRK